jgi:hypothetical protein
MRIAFYAYHYSMFLPRWYTAVERLLTEYCDKVGDNIYEGDEAIARAAVAAVRVGTSNISKPVLSAYFKRLRGAIKSHYAAPALAPLAGFVGDWRPAAGSLLLIALLPDPRPASHRAAIARLGDAYGRRLAGNAPTVGAWEIPPPLAQAVEAIDEVASQGYHARLREVWSLVAAGAPAAAIAEAALRLREELLPEYAPRAHERALEGGLGA